MVFRLFFIIGYSKIWNIVSCFIYFFDSLSVMSDSLRPHGLYSPWNSPGQNTGVGGLSLLQGIFPTQGSNPALLHCRWIIYLLSHQGSPFPMLYLVAYLFYIWYCVSVNPIFPNYPPSSLSFLATIHSFSMTVSLLLFYK